METADDKHSSYYYKLKREEILKNFSPDFSKSLNHCIMNKIVFDLLVHKGDDKKTLYEIIEKLIEAYNIVAPNPPNYNFKN